MVQGIASTFPIYILGSIYAFAPSLSFAPSISLSLNFSPFRSFSLFFLPSSLFNPSPKRKKSKSKETPCRTRTKNENKCQMHNYCRFLSADKLLWKSRKSMRKIKLVYMAHTAICKNPTKNENKTNERPPDERKTKKNFLFGSGFSAL